MQSLFTLGIGYTDYGAYGLSTRHESNESLSPERRYLYLLLYSPGHTKKINEPIKDSTHLQKIMHVLSTFIPTMNIKFQEHNYGAYSPALANVQDEDIESGFIDREDADPKSIRLTDKGMVIARRLWDNTSEEEQQAIIDIKDLLNEMKYWELMAFSYSTFPETTTNSKIKSDMERHRLDSAVSLFKRERLSTGKAASIAGMPLEDFIEELGRRGIPAFEMDGEHFKASLKRLEKHLFT